MAAVSERYTGWQISTGALLGGFVFGLGAAINGACAFSTLARLADGQLAMLGALGGFVLGILGYFSLVDSGWLTPPSPSPSMVGLLIALTTVIDLPLIVWPFYEGVRLWRRRPPQSDIMVLLLAPQYRLSTAAMLIGLANGGLYLIYGAWGYTGTLQQTAEAVCFAGISPLRSAGSCLPPCCSAWFCRHGNAAACASIGGRSSPGRVTSSAAFSWDSVPRSFPVAMMRSCSMAFQACRRTRFRVTSR